MKFSLIICGYNEQENVGMCINSCLNQNYPKEQYEIIYVDNNSTDRSVEVASEYPVSVLLEKKQGLSEARNCGIRNARGEILCFLDADLKLDENYLYNHQATFDQPIVGAGGGKVLPLIKTWISDYLGVSMFEGYPRYAKEKFVRSYPGCNLTIRKRVIEEVGLFKEGLVTEKGVTRFSEDKEMCERVRGAGYKILYNPKPVVYHKNTFLFTKLFQIWVKGGSGRVNMIRMGKTDFFSLVFRFNLPIIAIFIFLIIVFVNLWIGLLVMLACSISVLVICIKSYIDTRLFLQCFIVKPWMDILSLVIINISIMYRFHFK